jgi:hypothetical protein
VKRDEQGSLIIALAVILILSGLSLAVLARTISALASARLAQDSAAAGSAANTGVTDALTVLDDTTVSTPTTLTGSGTSFAWTASIGSASSGTVKSTGTVNGHSHTVVVNVTRGPVTGGPAGWPWLLATASSLVLDGAGTITGTPAALASGGQMVLRNGAPGGTEQDLLGPGASCSGCGNAVVEPTTVTFADPVLPVPSPSAPTGGCTGITTLATGTYLCRGTVSFSTSAPVSVAPGVIIYVTALGSNPPTLNFTGATVNGGGSAANLVVHMIGAGVVEPGDAPSAGTFDGVIDAPRSSLSSNPCDFVFQGAALLGSLDCTTGTSSGPQFTVDTSGSAAFAPAWQEASYGDATP